MSQLFEPLQGRLVPPVVFVIGGSSMVARLIDSRNLSIVVELSIRFRIVEFAVQKHEQGRHR